MKFTRPLLFALAFTFGAALLPQAAPHVAEAVTQVSVWPALGTTVTLDDGVTVITASGAVVTYTAEIRSKLSRGTLLTHDPRPGSTGIIDYPTSQLDNGAPIYTSQLLSRAGNYNGQPVVTNGYTTGVTRCAGRTYRWNSASTVASDGGYNLGSSSVGRWELQGDGSVNVACFGARGDDSTDDTAAIQSAIDYAVNHSIREVFMPSGVYRISHTIHLGKAGAFTTVVLLGQGPNYGLSTAWPGTVIRATHSDSPAINVIGARQSGIKELSIAGLANGYFSGRLMGNVANTTYPDTNASDWDMPGLNANHDSRYTPYAGIAIDGWAGTAPATHYPTTYMAYGQPASSDVLIDRVHLRGFTVGLAIQPADYDGNGDFVVVRNSTFMDMKWGISVGNTQSRNASVSNSNFVFMHTVFTTTQHGRQSGQLGTMLSSISVDSVTNIFKLGTSAVYGPLKVASLYGENVWRIGDFAHTTSVETSLEFDSIRIGFHAQTDWRGVPATVLSAGSAAKVKFNGGVLSYFPSVVSMNTTAECLEVDGMAISSLAAFGSTMSKEYMAAFNNASSGGFIFPRLATEANNKFKYRPFNIDTKVVGNSMLSGDGTKQQTNRPYGVSAWIKSAGTVNGHGNDAQRQVRYARSVGKGSFSSLTFTQSASKPGELVMVINLSDSDAMLLGPDVGDIVWDDQTGMVFAVRDRSGTAPATITAEAQNNYKLSNGAGSAYTTVTPFSTSTGSLYFLNSRIYRPTYPVLADITSASPTLASAGRDDGVATFLGTDIVADPSTGDRVFIDDYSDRWMATTSSMVTAVSTGSATITMAGNASRTVNRKLFPWFIRRVTASGSR